MKFFLLAILSLLVVFTYSCGGDEDSEDSVECKIDKDCNDTTKFCNTDNKCETTVVTGVLTSIEVDIDGAAGNKEVNLLIGEKKTVIAYGIYDNDVTEAEDISSKARWYSSDSIVGVTNLGTDGQTVKFEAKAAGTTEIYCKYDYQESEHVIFTVSEGVITDIMLSSKVGNSIFLHQATTWDIIADIEGGNQIRLDETDVVFNSTPSGLSLVESEYKFSSVGTYDVWVTKDVINSNHLSIEVKENVVVGLELNYDRDTPDFFVNTAHAVIVKEIYEANGENILTDATGITWTIQTRTDNGDGTYTPVDAVDGTDYSIEGFNITFKKADTFYVTISKDYGADSPFTSTYDFLVKEAK